MPDDTLDARGLACPIPFLLTRKRLAAMPAGALLLVLADDPRAADDMAAIAETGDCQLIDARVCDGINRFTIRKLAERR